MATAETMSPGTAVTGATYWWHEVGISVQIQWAPWVSRQTADLAGARRGRENDWGDRVELMNRWLTCEDLDIIAESTGGEITLSKDFTGRGGKLTFEGLMDALDLAARRASSDKQSRPDGLGMAEIAAACEIEGTPLAPVATYTRPSRRCVECGSLVYGDHCTHCHEG